MRAKDTPWQLPDRTVERADTADREIRMSDFTLMAALPFATVGISDLVPLNEVCMGFLVVLCLMRPARGGAKLPQTAVFLLVALIGLLLFSGVANDVDWSRRIGHLVIGAGVIWAGGTGRLSTRSVGAGLATGLIVVIALASVGIPSGGYEGRLTGFLGDPNAGAYFIVVLGLLAVFFADDRTKVRVVLAAPILVGLVLCYSRTGLLAGLFGALWLLAGRKLGVVGGVLFAAGLVWLVDNIPQSLITFGPFSDRSGSDKLRDRIIAQEHVQLADMPWFGHGPGTAKVEIRGLTFFFHNSYLATRHEGGWIALILILGLMVFAFLRLSKQSRAGDMHAAAAQAALISSCAMAITLGEVLLDTPVAVAIALALGQALPVAAAEEPDG